ncbi:MAG: hypothetical protein R2717_08275 [Schumannella sp.]
MRAHTLVTVAVLAGGAFAVAPAATALAAPTTPSAPLLECTPVYPVLESWEQIDSTTVVIRFGVNNLEHEWVAADPAQYPLGYDLEPVTAEPLVNFFDPPTISAPTAFGPGYSPSVVAADLRPADTPSSSGSSAARS